jgi:hypothetical protein
MEEVKMQFKQGVEGYRKNIDTAMKKLLPAVLKNTEKNGRRVSDWLVEHCAEGDVVDASTSNILAAVSALDGIGFIDWEIAPVKVPQKKKPDVLQSHDGNPTNHARENQKSEIDFQMAHEKKRREALGGAENRETMSKAVALVSNHSSVSHSRTYRERAALKVEFDKLVSARVHPKDLLAALQAKQDTFANGDITRPHLGGK